MQKHAERTPLAFDADDIPIPYGSHQAGMNNDLVLVADGQVAAHRLIDLAVSMLPQNQRHVIIVDAVLPVSKSPTMAIATGHRLLQSHKKWRWPLAVGQTDLFQQSDEARQFLGRIEF